MSLSHLVRVFKNNYLKTPRALLIEVRIESAKTVLIETDDEVIKIAYDVGFMSMSSFYKHFKAVADKSPNDYKTKIESEQIHE